MVNIKQTLATAYKKASTLYWTLGAIAAAGFLLYRLSDVTELFYNNGALFAWSSLIASGIITALLGVNVGLMAYRYQDRDKAHQQGVFSAVAGFTGALASGCPVCGTGLLATLGVVGGLGVLPFKGFELKLLAMGLLGFSIFSSAKAINMKCATCKV